MSTPHGCCRPTRSALPPFSYATMVLAEAAYSRQIIHECIVRRQPVLMTRPAPTGTTTQSCEMNALTIKSVDVGVMHGIMTDELNTVYRRPDFGASRAGITASPGAKVTISGLCEAIMSKSISQHNRWRRGEAGWRETSARNIIAWRR